MPKRRTTTHADISMEVQKTIAKKAEWKPSRESLLAVLNEWIRQRPGLEFGNYGDVTSYRSECRKIARDKREAQALLAAVAIREYSITADDLMRAARSAYSGRLSFVETEKGGVRIEYCTGQYWPTEYRRAACAVLASTLWEALREQPIEYLGGAEFNGSRGDAIRLYFRRQFGRGIQERWFN